MVNKDHLTRTTTKDYLTKDYLTKDHLTKDHLTTLQLTRRRFPVARRG
jgi:hypothetical protein